jgi:hypothetical protein
MAFSSLALISALPLIFAWQLVASIYGETALDSHIEVLSRGQPAQDLAQ